MRVQYAPCWKGTPILRKDFYTFFIEKETLRIPIMLEAHVYAKAIC